MAWDGNGNYSRSNGVNSGSTVWQDDASAGTDIEANLHDTHDEDLATAIGACLTKNNETKPTANFDPNAGSTYDMGDDTLRWQHVYCEGVNFPATQVTSADANTLDDYEEGTWTPVLWDDSESGSESQTYTTQEGTYTKIGRLVFIHCKLVVSSIGTLTTTQAATIGGLPFQPARETALAVGKINPQAQVDRGVRYGAVCDTSALKINLYYNSSSAADEVITCGNAAADAYFGTGTVHISGQYEV